MNNLKYDMIKSSELKENDLINCHGGLFRCGEVKLSESHPEEIGPVYYVNAAYEGNAHENGSCSIPEHWYEDGWLIQGNDHVKWARVDES